MRALLLALVLVACGAPRVEPASLGLPPIRVLVAVNPASEVAVIEGVNGWARSTRGLRDWELTRDWADANVALLEIPPLTLCPNPAMRACTFGVGGLWTHSTPGDPMRVFLVTGQYEPEAPRIAMHELGHKLGLGHIDGTLMHFSTGYEFDLSCPDRASVEELERTLGVYGMAWCE